MYSIMLQQEATDTDLHSAWDGSSVASIKLATTLDSLGGGGRALEMLHRSLENME